MHRRSGLSFCPKQVALMTLLWPDNCKGWKAKYEKWHNIMVQWVVCTGLRANTVESFRIPNRHWIFLGLSKSMLEWSQGLTKLTESVYETSEPGYKSSGYEISMGTKRLVSKLPTMSHIKNFPESHIINPLLTKLVRSRWLDNGLVLLRVYGPQHQPSWSHIWLITHISQWPWIGHEPTLPDLKSSTPTRRPVCVYNRPLNNIKFV